ncbi:hypothetical protein BKH43_08320 [Helicobacter sp. 13S00401-1]|uniref:hypothetical protein n=1 Tax=Helicobacter sp. 13S00401-1 TaxID=1905758 RepID=UPI000BA52638|nr:hypothetical protein [Helicobacter sp. 13S00401-1]PAF46768.1 hypothetical protein BKH43_08320 [Helicobacter sp. 13S00401-1]
MKTDAYTLETSPSMKRLEQWEKANPEQSQKIDKELEEEIKKVDSLTTEPEVKKESTQQRYNNQHNRNNNQNGGMSR